MSKFIFSYTLCDAWAIPISQIVVYDTAIENIVCSADESDFKYTIPKDAITKIKKIIDKYYCIFNSENFEVEHPLVFDGTINSFSFNTSNKECKVHAFNLWYYENNCDKAPNAAVLLSAFKSISEILIENGVDLRFLKLE